MAEPFDLFVIGTGVAGTAIATGCAAAGWKVAIADERPYGGTCALRGCDPKRVMLGVAEALDQARRLEGRGLRGELHIDWAELQALRRSFTDPVPDSRERKLREAGIECLHGHARLVGVDRVAVADRVFQANHIALASGARPAPLGIDGERHLLESDDFLELDTLPARLALVGGGYIGFEFAHLAARAGAEVVLLHQDDQPLAPFEPELVARLIEHSRLLGIDVRLQSAVTAVEPRADGVRLRLANGKQLSADIAVHTAGRVPTPLSAEPAARVQLDESGRPLLNRFLQSLSNPAVYVAGDADASGPPLTPVASYEAGIVVDNLLHGPQRVADYGGVPSAVFTWPPLASVGLTEAAARRQGMRYRSFGEDTDDWFAARRRHQPAAFKLLLEEESDRLLGAHLFGADAAEQINLFALAIQSGLQAAALREAIFAYPTAASELGSMLPESLRAPGPAYHNPVHRHRAPHLSPGH